MFDLSNKHLQTHATMSINTSNAYFIGALSIYMIIPFHANAI